MYNCHKGLFLGPFWSSSSGIFEAYQRPTFSFCLKVVVDYPQRDTEKK